MKIRNGFVSNSSGSSFFLIYLPVDFDFDAHMEYLLDKYKNKGKTYSNYKLNEIKSVTASDIEKLRKNKKIYEQDDGKFYELSTFLNEYILMTIEVQEEAGEIKLLDATMLNSMVEMDRKCTEMNNKFRDLASNRKEKRIMLKDKTKYIDPYEEENWDDEENLSNESNVIREYNKFKRK